MMRVRYGSGSTPRWEFIKANRFHSNATQHARCVPITAITLKYIVLRLFIRSGLMGATYLFRVYRPALDFRGANCFGGKKSLVKNKAVAGQFATVHFAITPGQPLDCIRIANPV